MKRSVVSLLPVLGLVGCGTLSAPAPEAPSAPPGVAAPATTSEVDTTRMGLIEYFARKRGVQVVWINPPRKNVAVATGG